MDYYLIVMRKKNLKKSDKYPALANIKIYSIWNMEKKVGKTWKKIYLEKYEKTVNLKHQLQRGMTKLNRLMNCILHHIENYFE